MRFASAVALAAVLAVPTAGRGEDPAARVARLVRQLGDDKFAAREAAGRELEAIGEPALAACARPRPVPTPRSATGPGGSLAPSRPAPASASWPDGRAPGRPRTGCG
jgi:hypothetical protein